MQKQAIYKTAFRAIHQSFHKLLFFNLKNLIFQFHLFLTFHTIVYQFYNNFQRWLTAILITWTVLQLQMDTEGFLQWDRNTRLHNSFFRRRGRIPQPVSSLSSICLVFCVVHVPFLVGTKRLYNKHPNTRLFWFLIGSKESSCQKVWLV